MPTFHSFAADKTSAGLDDFTRAYIEAAYWTDTGDGEQPDSEAEASPAFIAQAKSECADFQQTYAELLQRAYNAPEYYSPKQAGIDFWLTRNGHGAGFWDRGIGAAGRALTDAAHNEGSRDVYAGDDGLLYFM